MRTLLLDYQQNRRKPDWTDIVLLAGGFVMAIYIGVHSVNVFSEVKALEEKQTVLDRKPDHGATDSRLASLDAQQLRSEVKQANDILAQLALPWETLFKDIESSQKDHVALLSIEPDTEKHAVKITGEAKNLDTVLGYIRFLQKKSSLTGVYLQTHRVDQQMAEKPVRFVVTATWVIKP